MYVKVLDLSVIHIIPVLVLAGIECEQVRMSCFGPILLSEYLVTWINCVICMDSETRFVDIRVYLDVANLN